MMQTLVDSLLQQKSTSEQVELLRANVAHSAEIATQLKTHADGALRTAIDQATDCADLLHLLADITDTPTYIALARRVEGNVALFKDGDYQQALEKFEDAAAIYVANGDDLAWASSQIGAVACLNYLGKSADALTLAAKVRTVLQDHADWKSLFQLVINTSTIHNRQGDVRGAVAQLDEAIRMATDHDLPRQYLAAVEQNRAHMLLNLGELQTAEQAATHAETLFGEMAHTISVARARRLRALIYFNQNRYNEAFALLDDTRHVYLEDQRTDEALWTDLYALPALLQLGHYERVLTLTDSIETQFRKRHVTHELATVIRHAAVAHAGLQQFTLAHETLMRARALCQDSGDRVQEAMCQLEQATLYMQQQNASAALTLATQSAATFTENDQTLRVAQAQILVAQAHAMQGDVAAALVLMDAIESIAEVQQAYWLLHQIYALRGRLSQSLAAYERALELLERVRGRLITEFRADFLHDKQQIYEEAVEAAIGAGKIEQALQWTERAKSRALVEMIGQRVDLRIQSRSAEDAPRIAELEALQAKRNLIYRRWTLAQGEDHLATRQQLRTLEAQITERWHQLLVKNGDYARDASLTQVRSEPIQPYLTTGTLLIDCFTTGEDILFFLVDQSGVEVVRVRGGVRRVAKLMRMFNLNIKATSTAPVERVAPLLQSARKLLGQLYNVLIRPIAPQLAAYSHLLIAPHNAALHYLPFQALFDGQRYLGQQFAISYLPSAALLAYQAERTTNECEAVVFGYSNQNYLPHAMAEAQTIASLLQGRAYVETEATIDAVKCAAESADLLHFSTHGDFNQANPLFSGLALADGQLSTLDIFNMRLNASLVTLSACQTGRSVVKGGDELMGLMRAFLYAGADSLVLGLWQVNDLATLRWMETFYHALQAGQTKAQALQTTYITFISDTTLPDHYQHPYFWSPFFLVGKTNAL